MMLGRRTLAVPVLPLVLISCLDSTTESERKAKAQPPKPPELVSGMSGYYKMYNLARTWATDLQAFRLEPINLTTLPGKDGKYAAWRATFVSESKRSMKPYSYSVIEAEGVHRGIFGGFEEAYTGPRGQNVAFLIQALKIDSDAALGTALKKGAEYSKKHPDIPVTLLLEKVKQFPNPVWRVIWGTSVLTSNYSIYIDASTGEYLLTMH